MNTFQGSIIIIIVIIGLSFLIPLFVPNQPLVASFSSLIFGFGFIFFLVLILNLVYFLPLVSCRAAYSWPLAYQLLYLFSSIYLLLCSILSEWQPNWQLESRREAPNWTLQENKMERITMEQINSLPPPVFLPLLSLFIDLGSQLCSPAMQTGLLDKGSTLCLICVCFSTFSPVRCCCCSVLVWWKSQSCSLVARLSLPILMQADSWLSLSFLNVHASKELQSKLKLKLKPESKPKLRLILFSGPRAGLLLAFRLANSRGAAAEAVAKLRSADQVNQLRLPKAR